MQLLGFTRFAKRGCGFGFLFFEGGIALSRTARSVMRWQRRAPELRLRIRR